jgi:4-oxalocrotonate tautomerase
MSGDVPDVRGAAQADDGRTHQQPPPEKEHKVSLIQVKVIAGVFTAPQKREIVESLTNAMVAIEGECMRQRTWCVLEEVTSGEWGVGGELLTADDIRALGRADTP